MTGLVPVEKEMFEKIESDVDLTFAREVAGGQTVSSGSTAAVSFDTTQISGTNSSHSLANPTRISFAEDGLFEISYNLGFNSSSIDGFLQLFRTIV